MDTLGASIMRIEQLPGAQVDRGFGQDREVVRQQYMLRHNRSVSDPELESKMDMYPDFLHDLQTWLQPYQLPSEYRTFLDLYGGLLLQTTTSVLVVNGFGPMCQRWYEPVDPHETVTDPGRDGVLEIGHIQFSHTTVVFCIDLAGKFQRGSVVGVGPWSVGDPEIAAILANPADHATFIRVLAPSFTDWVAAIADTGGIVGYHDVPCDALPRVSDPTQPAPGDTLEDLPW